jgi:hypothetical protein
MQVEKNTEQTLSYRLYMTKDMDPRKVILRTFNGIFEDVVHYILSKYPDNPHLIAAYSSFQSICRTNETILVKYWYKWIYLPYKDNLENGGVDFFLAKEYHEDVSGTKNAGVLLQAIEQIRTTLQTMTPSEKEFIREKLVHLNKLSNKWTHR